MTSLNTCAHLTVSHAGGRVTVRAHHPTGTFDQKSFGSKKAAEKYLDAHLYCGRRGAALLKKGDSMDRYWAEARMNGVRKPAKRKPAKRKSSCGCG